MASKSLDLLEVIYRLRLGDVARATRSGNDEWLSWAEDASEQAYQALVAQPQGLAVAVKASQQRLSRSAA